jgi:hypothetical protein
MMREQHMRRNFNLTFITCSSDLDGGFLLEEPNNSVYLSEGYDSAHASPEEDAMQKLEYHPPAGYKLQYEPFVCIIPPFF